MTRATVSLVLVLVCAPEKPCLELFRSEPSLEQNARDATVYVFLPVVERTMGLPAEGKMLHDGRKAHALARALARVLAHETVHVIDPDIPHGPEGSVMSENLTSAVLLGHRLAFHEDTARKLFERLLESVPHR